MSFEKRRDALKIEIGILNLDMFYHYFEIICNDNYISDDETVYLFNEFSKVLHSKYNDTYILNAKDIKNSFDSLRIKYKQEQEENRVFVS